MFFLNFQWYQLKIFLLSYQLGYHFHFHVNKFYVCEFQSSFTKLSLTHMWFESIYLSIIRIVVCSDTFIIVFMHLKSKSIKSMTVKCITMIHVLQYILYLNSHHHSAWVEKMYITFTFFFSELESRNFHIILILKLIHTMLLKGADIWQFGWDILTYSLF